MAEFVNKVKKNNVEYEIRDARIPEATAEYAGKVLKVADAGGYELGEAGGSEPTPSVIDVTTSDNTGTTFAQLFDEVGVVFNQYVIIKYTKYQIGPGAQTKETKPIYLTLTNYGSKHITINGVENDNGSLITYRLDKNVADDSEALDNVLGTIGRTAVNTSIAILDSYPRGSGSYVLKAISGELQWVEETA